MKFIFLRTFLYLLVLFSFVGCATLDYHLTEFKPLNTTGEYSIYSYKAFASFFYPHDSENAEKTRMIWLEKWLKNNNLSTKYEIVNRQEIVKVKALLGTGYDIYYEIKIYK